MHSDGDKKSPSELLKDFYQNLFDIREGEGLRATLMFAYIFLVISSLMIAKPVSNSLFLTTFGASRLPYVFIIMAIFAAAVSAYIGKLLRAFHLFRVILKTIYASLASLLAFWVLIQIKQAESIALFAFYVWVAIFALISASQFWILANSIFNLREAKRLFGFIGSGAISGGIFGGYFTNILAPVIGSEHLLLICAGFLSLCVPIIKTINKKTAGDRDLQEVRQQIQTTIVSDYPLKLIRSSRHLLLLAGILGISVVVAKLVEYQFSAIASTKIPDEDALTAFFGFWLSNLNIASLLIQLFVTRRVVGIFGVGTSLFFLPIGIFVGAILILVNPALWSAILIKVSDGSLKNSINKAGIELMALPIPIGIKNQVKAFIDIFVDSFATGLGGVLLLLATSLLNISVQHISLLIIAFLLLWIYLIGQIRYEYIQSFRLKLEDRQPARSKLKEAGKLESILGGLIAALQGSDEKQILKALRMTKEVQNDRLVPYFKALFQNPSRTVRLELLKNIYFYKNADFAKEVGPLISDGDLEIRTEAMHYLFRRASADGIGLLQTFLNSGDTNFSSAALLCAARECRSNPELRKAFGVRNRVEAHIKRLPHLRDDDQRRFIKSLCSRVIGAANIPELYPYLHILLGDSSPMVARSAILGAGESCQIVFFPILIHFLAKKEFQNVAQEALFNFGHHIIGDLIAYLSNPFVERKIRKNIPLVIAQFGIQKSADILIQNLSQKDPALRYAVIKALNQLRINFPAIKFDEEKVIKHILNEAMDYGNTLAALYRQTNAQTTSQNRTLQDRDPEVISQIRHSLMKILEERLDDSLERIFRLLGLKYPPHDIHSAYLGIRSDQPDLRMNAVEFLDNLLEPTIKRVIIPIVEAPPSEAMIDRTLDQLDLKIPTEFEGLIFLLNENDSSLQVQALELVAHLKDERYLPFIGELVNSPDPNVREGAHRALRNLGFVVQ